MTRIRVVAVAIGLSLMLALLGGVATLSKAQNPNADSAERKAKLRERVIELRTEVAVLHVEYDAIRDNLFQAVKKTIQRDAGDNSKELAEFKTAIRYEMTFGRTHLDKADEDELKKGLDDLVSEAHGKEEKEIAVLSRDLLGGDGKKERKAQDRLAHMMIDDANKGLKSKVDRMKKDFAAKARALNAKKLDLAEAERQYHNAQ